MTDVFLVFVTCAFMEELFNIRSSNRRERDSPTKICASRQRGQKQNLDSYKAKSLDAFAKLSHVSCTTGQIFSSSEASKRNSLPRSTQANA